MRGNSGAELTFCGDYVIKHCKNASDQVKWFELAAERLPNDLIRLPYVEPISNDSYRIEYIRGCSATQITSVQEFEKILNLVDHWGEQLPTNCPHWGDYLDRLHSHVSESDSKEMGEAYRLAEEYNFPGSFSHGDLTLENILIQSDGQMVLIDPNFSEDLFQSWVLDYGKLLQSTHSDYHRVFNSSPGSDPAPFLKCLWNHLERKGLLELALVAELTHLMRLRKYRREKHEREMVDRLLVKTMQEIHDLTP